MKCMFIVHWMVEIDKYRIAAVVVTYNRLDLLKECINSIRQQTRKLDEIIVVNNSSTDGTLEWLNEGRKGRKTSDKEELLPYLKKHNEVNYVIFFLGVNDLKDGNDSLVNSCVQNMKWMIQKTKEILPDTKIIVVAPCSVNLQSMSELNKSKLYNENTKKSLEKLESAYKKLSEEESVGFISLLNVVSKENFADGLHPNIEGHREIADKIWSYLKSI